jgi:hypothetical protein
MFRVLKWNGFEFGRVMRRFLPIWDTGPRLWSVAAAWDHYSFFYRIHLANVDKALGSARGHWP